MRPQILAGVAALAFAAVLCANESVDAQKRHINPMINLLEAGKPVFGLYAPANPRAGGAGRAGAAPAVPAAPPPAPKTPLELAQAALAYTGADYTFSGSMEGGVDRGLAAYMEFVNGIKEATKGRVAKRHALPLVVKMQDIGTDYQGATAAIGKQLNAGVSAIMFVGVESAEEVRQGIAAMRFRSHAGTRSEDVGGAPEYWGMTEKQYKAKADVWPLNKDGELVNWTIVESKEGIKNVREIAAVPGIGVLWPGAGTLRGVYSTMVDGQRRPDPVAWEAAIQTVLAACKEFKVACGYPATPDDIEMRMKQGFSVFVMNWGDNGFKAIDIGKKLSGRK
jgi:2-keto-3-deoxy-L-rhamnonate aldolase RhmA